jgi:hypothetical protein
MYNFNRLTPYYLYIKLLLVIPLITPLMNKYCRCIVSYQMVKT